jgi:hypothetical protein
MLGNGRRVLSVLSPLKDLRDKTKGRKQHILRKRTIQLLGPFVNF